MSGLISRVADHCFWLGRYVERAESTARLLQATRGLALDTDLTPEQCWRPMITVAGEEHPFLEKFGLAATSDAETVEQYMTWSEDNFASLVQSVRAGRENARSIREVVSLDSWEVLNELYLWLASDAARQTFASDRFGFYRHVRDSVQLCLGLLRSTMLHDQPLDFIWLGVMLERAGQTARLLDVHHPAEGSEAHHPVIEMSIWLSLLRAASALEPFMQRNRGRVSSQGAAAFLILEPRLPRSLRYCIHDAHGKLARIRPPGNKSLPGSVALDRLRALDEMVSGTDPASIKAGQVHALLTQVVDEIAAICNCLNQELLGVTPPVVGPSQEQSVA